MKTLVLILLILALVGGAAMMLMPSGEREWSTDSEQALEEFEAGLAARMKYYASDARDHFANAAAADPEFAAARLYLSFYEHKWDEKKQIQEGLREVDLSTLTPRERFLLEFHIAEWDRDLPAAKEIGEQYVEDHPHDPFGLATLADLYWAQQDWDESERLYDELLDIAPNWVTAQNRLGYIALARGQFEEAEEHFRSYNYIAPDQANPHDSMGELLVLLGRYGEAREAFERALAIRPDFCNAYQHLVDVSLMEGRPEDGEAALERAAEVCSPRMIETLRCSLIIWHDFMTGNSDQVWTEERSHCREVMGEYHFLIHRTACLTDQLKLAERAERGLERGIEAAEEARHVRLDYPRGLLLHMQGTRLLAEKRYEEAAEAFAAADSLLYYWGEGQGILKLYNQMNLAWAQEKLGMEEESTRTLERVRRVNEPFAASYPESVEFR